MKMIYTYFSAVWIIEFILAGKDVSVGIDEYRLAFTFRTWMWIDGATTIGIGFIIILISIAAKQCVDNFMKVYLLFKATWIIVGFASFMKLSF